MDIVPHTGISIYGVEYFFSGGVQCEALGFFSFNSNVPVHSTLDLGHTEIPRELFEEFCAELGRQRFHAEAYNLMDNNCDHFTNECANFLLGVSIPHDILHLPNRVLATPMGQMLRPMFEMMGRPLNNALQGGSAVSNGSAVPLFSADDISGLLAPPAPSAVAPRAAATPSAPFSPATPSLMGPPRAPPHAAATPATSAHRSAPAATPATVLQPRGSGAMSTPAAHAAARPAAPQSGGRLSALRAPPSSFKTPMAGGPLSKSSRPLLACEGETAAVAARLATVAAPLAKDEAQRVALASLDTSLRSGVDAADAEPLGRLFASLLQSLGGANQFVLLYATRLLTCEPSFARAWLGGGALAALVTMLNAPPPEAASAGARVMGFVAVSNLVATREGLSAMASTAPAADASALLGAALAAAALPGAAGAKEAQAAAALLQNLALSIRELAPSPGDAPLVERARLQLLSGLADPLAVQVSPCKILFHFIALLWESNTRLLPPPLAKPTLLQYYCPPISQYTPPPPTTLLYDIHHILSAMAISCTCQRAGGPRGPAPAYGGAGLAGGADARLGGAAATAARRLGRGAGRAADGAGGQGERRGGAGDAERSSDHGQAAVRGNSCEVVFLGGGEAEEVAKVAASTATETPCWPCLAWHVRPITEYRSRSSSREVEGYTFN